MIKSESHSSIASSDGNVPNRPIPPVVNGESSGTTALPRKAFMTGAANFSAISSMSSPQSNAPCRTQSRFCSLHSEPKPRVLSRLMKELERLSSKRQKCAPVFSSSGSSSFKAASCKSIGKLMCATPRSAKASRQAMSVTAVTCCTIGCYKAQRPRTTLGHLYPAGNTFRSSRDKCVQ
ncbi:hypothetical protein BCL69_107310 [Nitrosomonas communis]|uniref:Uncharacterized protein n=1 Tax=Nitrosomonas communis TaxID=44574 RepID=A0A5D3Y858_9PROT|nr:hypothetical protein BCL69_107310 [Nitrosomonas communis]